MTPEVPSKFNANRPKVKVTAGQNVCKKNRKIINNLAADCSISLEFRTDFDHVTLDTTNFQGQRIKEFKGKVHSVK